MWVSQLKGEVISMLQIKVAWLLSFICPVKLNYCKYFVRGVKSVINGVDSGFFYIFVQVNNE